MRNTLFAFLTLLPITTVIADTEPNNTWQTALALPQDRTIAGTQSDVDWYVINISSNQTVQRILIDLTFTHSDGNIDMSVYGDDLVTTNPSGSFPGSIVRDISNGTTSDHEFIDHNVSIFSPETYYIQISGQNLDNGYTLTWTELTGSDDEFEVNNDNSQAKAITEGMIAFGLQRDHDWYSIEVSSGSTQVLASLRFFNTQVAKKIDLDLVLHDVGGTSLALSTNPAGENETIEFNVVNPGTYHLQVSGNDKGDGYALNWAGVSPTSLAAFPAPSVNQAPTAIANTATTTQNTPFNFAGTDFTFSDSEGDDLLSVVVQNLSLGGGTLTHSGGVPVNDAGTLAAAQLDTLVYTPPVDSTGSPLATFDFTVNDLNTGTVAAQMDINVTAVPTTSIPTSDPAATDTSSSSGALSPAWLLALMLAGLCRIKRR